MDVFYALAEPTRRRIVELLAVQGQLSASAISHHFRVSQPAISQHLKVLRELNIIKMQKHAQQRLYQVNRQILTELEQWAKSLQVSGKVLS